MTLDLSVSVFEPDTIIAGIKGAFEPYLSRPEVVLNGCQFLIERQTQMLNVYKVGLVDMAMRAWLAGLGIKITTIIPQKVKEFFSIQEQTHKRRKTSAIRKVRALIASWDPSMLSVELKDRFLQAEKKDDMADALLQWVFHTK